jgi:anoctamin-10
LTNTALVRLFEPAAGHGKAAYNATRLDDGFISVNNADTPEATRSFHYKGILGPAMLLALSSSHAYILARLAIRHLLVRLFWKGSKEATIAQEADREVKRAYLRQLEFARGTGSTTTDKPQPRDFWERDEGSEEISRGSKEL